MAGDRVDEGSDLFTHIVLTRFNVRMPMYDHPAESWLETRLELFRTYCLPTFSHQTTMRFRWLLFLDSETPTWFSEALRQDVGELAELVFVDGYFTGDVAARAVAERVSTPFLITTRVDNDDAVANDFIEVIQREFLGEDLEVVNLVNGAQYANRKLYLRWYTKNPFVSVYERVTPDDLPRTAYYRRHFEVELIGPVRDLRTPHPMWCQILHGGNVLNELVGLRKSGGSVTRHFSCDLPVDDTPGGLAADTVRDGARIFVRLLRSPARIEKLARAVVARRSRPRQSGAPVAPVS